MTRRLAAVLLLGLLGGCSAMEFAYRNADTWLRWQGGYYLDLRGVQADAYAASADAFLAWHRARALPQYARLAEEAGARLAQGASREDLLWGYDAFRAQMREGLRRAGAAAAGVLDGLSPAQIEHLKWRFAQANRKFAQEHVEGSPAQRKTRRARRLVQGLEDWLGELNDAQRERVRQFSERAPLYGALRERERHRRQAELLAMLRAGESVQRLAGWAAEWEGGREPALVEAVHALMAEFFDMLADLERTLSPAQRTYAVARFRGYARDFDALAAAR